MALRSLVFGLALSLAASVSAAGELVGRVVNVHDGDSLTLLIDRRQVKIRLAEIDAPEIGQAFWRAARDELAAMCAGGTAYVEDRGLEWRRKRTLGQVRCGSWGANAEQVRRGMAWVYPAYAPKNSPLYALERAARLEKRGLWADDAPVPPWEWRRERRQALDLRSYRPRGPGYWPG